MAPSQGVLLASGVIGTVAIGLIAASGLLAESRVSTTTTTTQGALYCVTGGFVATLNDEVPRAKCFRVRDGVFTDIYEEEEDVPPEYEEHDVVGGITWVDGFVLPGIVESHGHILAYGEMLESVSLYGAESVEEMRSRIKKFLKAHEGEGYGAREKWVRGIGWDQAYFGGVMPTAEELGEDPSLADLYIMLDRVDVHCVLTSQKVLELLSNPLPGAPPGGVIVTEPGPGVFCDNAMDAIIYPLAPKANVADKTRWFKTAMVELNKVGIVGMGDAGMRPDDVKILERLAEAGELTVRMNVMLECVERNTFCPEETTDSKLVAEDGEKGMGEHMLLLGGVKLFADGALGSWGAALLEAYSDKSETRGTMLINETELTKTVEDWSEFGFQVNIHAIGDRANRAAVDAFEEALGPGCDGCNEARRFRIEHAQIIHPDDQKRMARMGIIASIQPTHATSDMAYAGARLGAERVSKSAYRMASLFPSRSSSSLSSYPGPVLGSDFPVEPPNPFHGMYAAVTRLNPATGSSPSGDKGWHPEEALRVEQALLGFTRNAAYGWGRERVMGGIEKGKWADFTVVDRDVVGMGESGDGRALRDVKVKSTWVGGKRVFPAASAVELGSASSGETWTYVVRLARKWVLGEAKAEL